MARILKLQSENILPLKAISIEPNSSLVKISGANDSGKTTILRSIWMALGGKGEIPDDAIREGADSGYVELQIGDCGVVECTARLNLKRRDNGTIRDSITLKDEQGRTVSSPMALLKDMLGFGRGQFDPLAFRDAKPADQADMLQTALGLDFSELDQESKDQYEERTIINRQAKELEAQIGDSDPDAPQNEISVAELAEQHAAAIEVRASNERRTAEIGEAARRASESIAKREQLELQAEEIAKEIEALKSSVEDQKQALDILEAQTPAEVPDIDTIAAKMQSAEADNARVRYQNKHVEQTAELAELKARSEAFTVVIGTIKATKDKMIANADFPINGVEIVDNAILVNGHPLENQGGAAQLRFGVLLVMKSNPKLRVVTMDEALGKLDDESLEMFGVLLAEHNFQGWITGPRAVGDNCIEIRDGEIVTG